MNFRYSCPARSASQPFTVPIVFIIDSDVAVLDAVGSMIRSAGWQPVTASSAEEFLRLPRVTRPSCLLVDLHLPGLTGLDLQRRVFDRTEMPVIFMSRIADVRATVQAMKAGAFEFLTKPFASDVLLNTLRYAIERSEAALRQLTRDRALQERYEMLSRREREVMHLVVTGRLNKQVGCDLGISEITVKAHRGKLMRKMQAVTFVDLINMAAELRRGTPGRMADSGISVESALAANG